MSFNDRELLARIIKCEAGGEGDNGMRGVASVVMNRTHVSTGEYLRTGAGSMRRIIYQPGQFDCVAETLGGRYNAQNIYNMTPDEIHYQIADWALGGGQFNATGNSLWYMNPYAPCVPEFPYNGSGTFHTRVNHHCYYRPTAQYRLT